MAHDGFEFFLDQLRIPRNVVRANIDFRSGVNAPIPSGEGNFTGQIIGNFPLTNTGHFSGSSYINVRSDVDFYSPNWTMFFIFERGKLQNDVLFSNYTKTSGTPSGFVLGINAADNLYAETYTNSGPITYEANINLASKNAVIISKGYSSLSFNYFDFNSKKIESQNFFLDNSLLNTSGDWYLGAAPKAPSYFSGDNYTGFMDAFIYMTGNYFPYQIDDLCMGFTLSRAPNYYYTVLDENCSYSYANLTGEINDVIYNNINTMSYLVQTGYLINKVGDLFGNITGYIEFGTGHASGNIYGFINSGSGFVNITNTPFSGFFDVGLYEGLRVFTGVVPTGITSKYFTYPDNFTGLPVVVTDIDLSNDFLVPQLSGVSISGFYLNFSNPISPEYCEVNVFAVPVQNYSGFKANRVNIQQGVNGQFIQFDNSFYTLPKVCCNIENDIDSTILEYDVSEISTTGFNVNFSNTVLSNNYILNYVAGDLTPPDFMECRQDIINSGVTGQFIPFASPYLSNPVTIGQLINLSGEPIYPHKISQASNGFNVYFANTINSNNYRFDSITVSGKMSMVKYISGFTQQEIYLGQTLDEAKNIYNLSGLATTEQVIPSGTGITKNVFLSGVNTTITSGVQQVQVYLDVPVNYTVNVMTGQTDYFEHLIEYNNPGYNFLTVSHTLLYSSVAVQPDPFYIFKNCNQYMGLKLEDYLYDTGYIYSFGMEGVAYIGDKSRLDNSALTVYPSTDNKTNVNKKGYFVRTNGYAFFDNFYGIQDINIFENGTGLFSDNSTVDLGPIPFPANDYTLQFSYAIITHPINDATDIIYDITTNFREYYFVPNRYIYISGHNYLPDMDTFNKNLYLNGVKLESGIGYFKEQASGVNLIRINNNLTGIPGKIFSLPLDPLTRMDYTGYYDSVSTQRFPRNTSILYADGLRQTLNKSYIETSRLSLLLGQRILNMKANPIFQNDPGFWE